MAFQTTKKSCSKELARFQARVSIAILGLCLSTLLLFTGCVSSGATAATSNAQGVELFSSGQYDEAISYFQSSLEENPNSAETYYNLGSAYQRKANQTGDLNLLTQAEDAYWTALQTDPAPETIVCCYRGIATSSTARGDSEGAMRTLEEWSDRNPDSIEPKLELAYLLEALERDDEAYQKLEEVAQMAPDDYRAYYKMGVLAEKADNLEDALESTNIAAQLAPSNAELARRVRTLKNQYAAQQREEIEEREEEEQQTETETAVADAPIVTQTARVQSTSAQGETETTPELVLPDDSTSEPLELSPNVNAEPETQDSNDSAAVPNELGFGEIVLYSSADPNSPLVQNDKIKTNRVAANAPRFNGQKSANSVASKDDSDVKWISAASSQQTKVAQTSVNVPQKQSATQTKVKAAPIHNLAETKENVSVQTANEQAGSANSVPAANSSVLVENKKVKTREIGSGMPRIKAGSFF